VTGRIAVVAALDEQGDLLVVIDTILRICATLDTGVPSTDNHHVAR